jgi:hypothetical protein
MFYCWLLLELRAFLSLVICNFFPINKFTVLRTSITFRVALSNHAPISLSPSIIRMSKDCCVRNYDFRQTFSPVIHYEACGFTRRARSPRSYISLNSSLGELGADHLEGLWIAELEWGELTRAGLANLPMRSWSCAVHAVVMPEVALKEAKVEGWLKGPPQKSKFGKERWFGRWKEGQRRRLDTMYKYSYWRVITSRLHICMATESARATSWCYCYLVLTIVSWSALERIWFHNNSQLRHMVAYSVVSIAMTNVGTVQSMYVQVQRNHSHIHWSFS